MIVEAREIRENQGYRQMSYNAVAGQKQQNVNDDSDEDDGQLGSRTIVTSYQDEGTLVPERDLIDGTMIAHRDEGTLVPQSPSNTMVELQTDLGTMVINNDNEETTMKSKYLCYIYFIFSD